MSSSIRKGPRPSGVTELSLQGVPAGAQPGGTRTRRPTRYRSGWMVVAIYALGPFAPLALRLGGNRGTWAAASGVAVLAWGGTIWQWDRLRAAVESGALPLVPWMLGLALAALVWALAACRAFWLAGADPRFVPERLPRWALRPWMCGVLGFLLPGFGHLAAGHPRRAALAGWNAAALGFSAVLLWQAAWMWQCNRMAGAAAVPGLALEVLFLFAAAVAGVASLGWIAASLDGARLRAQRLGRREMVRGDAVAMALLVTLVAALFTVRPVGVARDLDRFAASLQTRGYRLVPLCLETVAMRFDRAEPRYVMVSAELLDALGKHEKAAGLRESLRQRWESYAEHLMRQELYLGDSLMPPFLDIGGDPLSWSPEWGHSQTFQVPPQDSLLAPSTTSHDSLSQALPD